MANYTEEVVLKLKDEFSAAASKVDSGIKSLTSSVQTLMGLAALAGLSEVMIKSVKAYAESEKATTQLGFALKEVGITSKSALKDYEEFANQLEKTTQFREEEVVSLERIFTQYGLYGDQLKRATKDTLDFATARGISSEEAANIFVRAAGGNVEALKRYGIQISDAQARVGGLNAVLQASEGRFKGFAEAALDSTAGRINQFTKSLEQLEKGFGRILALAEQKTGALKTTAGFFNDIADAAKANEQPINELSLKLIELAKVRDRLQNQVDTEAPMFIADFIKEKDRQALADIIKQMDEAQAKIVALQKAAETNVGSSSPTKKSTPIENQKQKDFELATKEYDVYYKNLLTQTGSVFDQIKAMRDKDIAEEAIKWDKIKKFLIIGSDEYRLFYQKHENALAQIDEIAKEKQQEAFVNTLTAQTSAIAVFAQEIHKDLSKAFVDLSTSISKTVGSITGKTSFGLVGMVFSAFVDLAKGVQQIFIGMDDDIRTTFTKVTDSIDAINRAIDDTESRLEELRTGKKRTAAKLQGSITDPNADNYSKTELTNIFGGSTGNQFLINRIRTLISNGSFTFQIADTGDVLFFVAEENICVLTFEGDWKAVGRWLGGSEELTVSVCKYMWGLALKQGLADINAVGVDKAARKSSAPTGLTPISGTKGGVGGTGAGSSTSISAGMQDAAGSTNVTINVNAVDEHGVRGFLINQLAPMMRDLSGRGGMVFLNERGVSPNA